LINLLAEAACVFSLCGQRKGTKRKATLRFGRYATALCFSPSLAQKINSLRSNKFLLNPMKAAMLGRIEGTKVKTQAPRTYDAV